MREGRAADGGNDGKSVVFDNPDAATGMLSLTVQNLGTGSTITGGDPNPYTPVVVVPVLALSADAGIGTATRPLQTQVNEINAVTSTGGVFINNGNAAPVTLNIGNGGGGVRAGVSGDIVLTNNGTIDSFSIDDLIRGNNITIKALGAGADVNFGNQTFNATVVGLGTGLVDLEAGRDINLGNSAGFGVVQGNGSIKIAAGRNLTLNANGFVEVLNGFGGISATAGGNITMTTAPGIGPLAPEFSTVGGVIALSTGAGGTLTLASNGPSAIVSQGGAITLAADAMSISQAVNASAGNVQLRSVSAGEAISLGAAAGGLQLTNAELNLVTAKTLTIGSATAGAVTLAGTVAPTHVTNLTINTSSNFNAAGSVVNVGAGILTIGFDENNLGAAANLAGAAITAGTVVVSSGAGNDTFITGAGPETINGGGGVDTAVFAGTRAQYTISPEGQTVLVTKGGVTDTLTGIKFLSFSDQTIPTPPPPSTPAGTTADLILQETSGANTGQVVAFDLGGNAILAGNPLGGIGLSWKALGLGDFAGNPNEADLLMRDNNTGNINYFDIQNTQIVAAGSMGSIGAEWQVLSTGDFSGNANETDMLMRDNNTGAVDYFDIQHNQIVSAGSVATIDTTWQTLGVGDFSGNPGEADMLMRNVNNGAIDYVDFQHNQIAAAGSMGNVGLEWQALGVGNFSGNAGESDLLMRDTQNGAIYAFDTQHNQFVGINFMGTIGAEWQALGVGDFSGVPGEADLAMRDTQNGAIYAFDIQHNQFTSIASLGNVGTEWQNLGVGTPLVPGSPLI